ncbi:hypothetical protein FS837_009252 [Tulasnella sp. UAMH 9824]|nr:hypothetical protein FS837_009252 [Tulasnella sp. UAMH 9824]
MSTEREIVENDVSTSLLKDHTRRDIFTFSFVSYQLSVLTHRQWSNSPDSVTDHGVPETLHGDDATSDALKRIDDLSLQETAELKRRRNYEHSFIYRLPPELITEVLLLAVDWPWWEVEKLRALASVSTAWRDTILSCNRFWPVMDVMASEGARAVTMKRNREGPVDIWCWERPSESVVEKFMTDVQMLQPARVRFVLYEYCWSSRSFMDWLRSNTSSIIDIFLGNLGMSNSAAHLDLSPEGPNLRHVDLRRMTLQWQCPRLSNLQTLFLSNLNHNVPSVNQLYTIVSSSPALERLCLLEVVAPDDQALGSLPSTTPPIALIALKTLAFDRVSTAITRGILPLIRARACDTVKIRERDLAPSLELQQATIELVTKAITLSRILKLKAEAYGGPNLHICSEPVIAMEWVYWAHDQPGVDVRLVIPSENVLPKLWDCLGDRLHSHGGASGITSLEVDWEGEAFPFPFALLEHCRALTDLQFYERLGTSLHLLIRFLGGNGINGGSMDIGSTFPLPNLNSLHFYARVLPYLDDCVNGTKEFLERRYPALQEGVRASDVQPLRDLCLPATLVDALKKCHLSTSLDVEKLVSGTILG